MGSEQFRIKGVFDESGIRSGAKGAESAVKGIGGAVDQQSRKLNKYGERLGKTFGKGQGLHGRLDSLEMPLRDAEGSFDRVQFAVREFGNAGATATDKVSAGFLLAGDSIATFVSGGVIGVAIAATVALGAAIFQAFTAAEKEAEEAEQAFRDLAKAAAEAKRSILGVSIDTELAGREATARGLEERLRLAEDTTRALIVKEKRLAAVVSEMNRRARGQETDAALERRIAANQELRSLRDNEIIKSQLLVTTLDAQLKNSIDSISSYSEASARRIAADAVGAISTAVRAGAKLMQDAGAAAGETVGPAAGGGADQESARVAEEAEAERRHAAWRQRAAAKAAEGEAFAIQAEAALARVAADRAFERQVEIENRAFDRDDKAETLRIDLAMEDERRAAAKRTGELKAQIYQEQIDAFKKAHEVEIMLLGLTTNALFDMAKAGEFSGKALLASVLEAVGQEAMAKGTLHLLEGLATANPAKMAAGSGLIGLGIALGGAAGVVERSGAEQAAAASGSATPSPSDTRSSRAASSGSGGGDGGQVVINFNGDVYDRRGVASVLSSGNRMAKHRRMAG